MLPENTLPAFEYAISAGADVLELDMAVTRDDVLVVSHDPVVNEELCEGPGTGRPIRSLTLAELKRIDCGAIRNPRFPRQRTAPGTRIPTLDEVFSLAPGFAALAPGGAALAPNGAFHFNIETKIFPDRPEYTPDPERFVELVLAAIRRHKLESRVILQSFDYRTLRVMKKLEPRIRLSALDEIGGRDFVATARGAGAGIISPHLRLVTPEKVKAAHAAGIQVIPWTANVPEEWDKLAAAGVDAIITDDPAALIEYLKRRGLR